MDVTFTFFQRDHLIGLGCSILSWGRGNFVSLTPNSSHVPSFGSNFLPFLVHLVIAREIKHGALLLGGSTHGHNPQKGLQDFIV